MTDYGISQGDFRGKPIIWPTSKQVQQAKSVEEAQSSSRNVSSQAASSPATASAAKAAAAAAAAAAAPTEPATAAPAARPMAMTDLVEQLLQLGVPNTPENKQMASQMMQYGIELSPENFQELFKLIKNNKSKSNIESAIVSLSKGLGTSSKSVELLSAFLSSNPQVAQQMQDAKVSLSSLQQFLQLNQNLMNPGLFAGLTSLLQDMDLEFQKQLKKGTDKKGSLAELKRGNLINGMKTMNQFLEGLEQKLTQEGKMETPEGRALREKFALLKKSLNNVMENLTSQVILSKDADRHISSINDKYTYWQILNPWAEKPSHIELAIKKDPHKKNGEVDPSKTRIVIKLETPELGEITIIFDVLDKKLWYIFNTDSDETGKFIAKTQGELIKSLEAFNYKVVGIQTIKKKVDIRKFILPTINLDNLVRIRTEV